MNDSIKGARVFLVAGERSGDTHGAALIRDLSRMVEGVSFRGLGGPEMAAAPGSEVEDWVEEAGVLGLWEVLKKYGWFRRRMAETVAIVREWRPDVVVLIDYPGFNLRLARRLQSLRPATRVVQYISPQVWAWNRRRIPEMARLLDRMLCIFPFEKELYESSGLATDFVGHPLGDALAEFVGGGALAREEGLTGLFPGSRMREIEKHLDDMLAAVALAKDGEPDGRWMVSAASEKLAGPVRERVAAAGLKGVVAVEVGRSREWMARCGRGMVASGTATLEAAMLGMPHCLVYRVARPTYWLGRMLVRVPHLGIANILAGREVVPEFIQDKLTPEALADWLRTMRDGEAREAQRAALDQAVAGLRQPGAHRRVAQAVAEVIRECGETADPFGPL